MRKQSDTWFHEECFGERWVCCPQCWPLGSLPQAGTKPRERGMGKGTGNRGPERFLYHCGHHPCEHTPAQATSLGKTLKVPCQSTPHSQGHNSPLQHAQGSQDGTGSFLSHRASFPPTSDVSHQGLRPSHDEPHCLQWEMLLMEKYCMWNKCGGQREI